MISMLRRFLFLVVFGGAFALIGCCPVSSKVARPVRPEPMDAAAILAKWKTASGGAMWDGISTIQVRTALAVGGLQGEADSIEDLRTGRFAASFTLGPMSGAQGYDGKSPWSEDQSGAVTVQDTPDEIQGAASQAYRTARAFWFADRWPAEIRREGEQTEGDRAFYVLSITPQGGREFHCWIDKTTFLLDRMIEKEAVATYTTHFSDYRELDGLWLAYHTRTTEGKPQYDQIATITEVTINPPLAETAFDIPTETFADVVFPQDETAVTLGFDLHNNHIYTDAQINGSAVRVLVDTGGANLLTPDAAAALGLEHQGALHGRGAGEKSVDVGMTKVKSLKVGDIELKDQLFYVVPLGSLPDVEGVDLAGLIGFEVFKRFAVSIDYADGRITLAQKEHFSPPKNAEKVPLTFQGRTPHIEAEIDGLTGVFTVDTGNRCGLTLHSPFVEKHGLVEKYKAETEALTGWGVGGGVRSRLARAEQIKIGGLTIPDTRIDLFTGAEGALADRYTAGNIGSGLLKRFTVTFDYKDKLMYLEPNRNFDKPEPHDKSGMWINRAADHFEVMDVIQNGPAHKAGIQKGDRILAVDNTPVAELTLPALREKLKTEPDGTIIRLTVKSGDKQRKVKLILREPR